MNNQNNISRAWKQFFGVKTLNSLTQDPGSEMELVGFEMQDEKSWIRNSKKVKIVQKLSPSFQIPDPVPVLTRQP
jgi:hypothetical protein